MANEKKQNKSKLNPVTVGLAGTAAVAAGVAAIALSKKSNRKKAGKILKDIKIKGEDLTKKASKGLDKVLREEQKVREKAQILRAKALNGNGVKSKTKNSTKTGPKSKSATRKSSKRTSRGSQVGSQSGMAN